MTILSTFKPSPRFTLPTPEQEDAIESAGLLLIAADHLRDEAREALMTTPASRESYSRYQAVTAALKSVERAAARAYAAGSLPVEALGFTPADSMGRHAEHLDAALEFVTAGYRAALPTVGLGGLVDASALDAARKAIQFELSAAGTSS
ncbi:hypothetical protein [Pseudarthrobacter sp. BIM B-2242]|uniref:hypothetical protein n=1 Tax=Pseudarthrobacter sp. BIM B-2242 TaxID=2772401 RepID=UPI00168A877E|nr:hypothetical protein [Pseudarthrobacter sp. BIM B-2242]QOD05946.1 hypothetical protein IDT60_20470 [Pseudarthrobacter sp. BIM B-2242]